ncbi:rhodanese-related sulfurtransferase [Kineococcus radiotolerans]|uniref:Rhodanese domain protein n=2 Tax=Kineococcus radiotolerans TaxID=131568 RepID=A6W4B8_KINRD|nr:rhodanese-like domain-containing protein [Kineococcus radiotolerans]ABS01657.1 Rhodanese domain protein [Kineococcus radiotolerans SRS30216 = ATCC BAA-149]MBB2901213.1 rhodanese-related sulfurtransferase [Kineococcus radiotolerans]
MTDFPTFDVDGVPTVAVTDLSDDAVVLDVREDEEWAAGHAPGALHIPMGQVPQRLGELPEGRVLVVCRSGGRSQRTAQWLQRNGHDVVNVDGGMSAWAGAGRAMVSETGQEPFVR